MWVGYLSSVIMELIMAKEINTYRDLSIKWEKKANRFQLDARPLGATRMRFKTKAEH